jgi:hypothetical protein
MLRACGSDGRSSLWRTSDGGATWTRLVFEGDFDGEGPSALCGEVVAFDLRDPQTLYVGCESKGFFRSDDDGETWRRIGLAGERVTAVNVWAWERYYPVTARNQSQIAVITCPDRWMTFLGRGRPTTAAAGDVSRTYVSNDGVNTLVAVNERPDTGFFNVIFDKASQSTRQMRYATTHGIQAQIGGGRRMVLYPPEKHLEWLRPYTAIDATARGEQKFGLAITQPLDPEVPGRLSQSGRWASSWAWRPVAGHVPEGGLIAVCGDRWLGEKWWFVFTDGLYYSPDGGEHLTKVMEPGGI